jgi:hypothetical protein
MVKRRRFEEKNSDEASVRRYGEPEQAQPAGESLSTDFVSTHVEKYVGKIDTVIHEIASPYVHIDVHVVPPSSERAFVTLVTSGMSDKPMTPPLAAGDARFAELVMCLPASTTIEPYHVMDEQDWAINWLRYVARFPHQYNTWLWKGHSIANGDPPQPLSEETKLCGCVLADLRLFAEDFSVISTDYGMVHLFGVIPVYKEEMEFKRKQGPEILNDLLEKYRVSELLNPKRVNVVAPTQ